MPALSRLIKIWALGRAISLTAPSLKQLLAGLAAIAVLGVISSVLIGASLVGALYFIFHILVMRGVDETTAMAVLAAATGLLIITLITTAWICWRRITSISRALIPTRSPLPERISNIVHQFVSGILDEDI